MTNSSQRRGYAVSLQVLDWIKEGIFILDGSGNIVHYNRSAERILGLLPTHLKHRKIYDFVETYNASNWASLWEDLSNCQLIKGQTQMKIQGKSIQIWDQLFLIDLGGEPYVAYYFEPLSEEQLLNTVYAQACTFQKDIILCFDPSGKLVYYNPATIQYTKYEAQNIDQLKLKDFFGEDLILEEVFDTPKAIRCLKIANGTSIPVEVQVNQVDYYDQKLLLVYGRPVKNLDLALQTSRLEEVQSKLRRLETQLNNEKAYLEQEITQQYNFNDIITCSKAYQKVLHKIVEVADKQATVLILGETGTGKELLARTIHKLSRQADQIMVKVNCAALPASLIESELFGHEKGAFTGAYQKKIGRFELAHNGTLFLDEIGELPLSLQAKILRVLQEGAFERLGSNKTQKVNVRIIAATNRDLKELVEEGKFRADLYYRINVFPIENIPLRARKGDIPLLTDYFIKKHCERSGTPLLRYTQKIQAALEAYHFPGNIRELENIIERAFILSKNGILNEKVVLDSVQSMSPVEALSFLSLEALQKQHIIQALEKTNWKMTGTKSAADLLQINGKTLASKMRKLNIRRP